MTASLRLAMVVVSLAVAGFLSGCSKSDENVAKVKGKLVKGGQPYQALLTGPKYPEGVGLAEVTLYPVKEDKEVIVDDNADVTVYAGVQIAVVQPDGTFEVPGSKGQGIPPGKYRFVVKHIDPLTEKDKLGGKFNEKNSKITHDLTADKEVVIDLGK